MYKRHGNSEQLGNLEKKMSEKNSQKNAVSVDLKFLT